MQLLDLTLATPAENLALDEALLEEAEHTGAAQETLRLWESTVAAVVLGRSSVASVEANLAECRAQNIPILRRPSGGAAVMIGPGCLMYSLVLSYERRPELHALPAVHELVLGCLASALRQHIPSVVRQGTSDLAFQPPGPPSLRKFSGNSLRCRRTHLLYHGTLLYNFPPELISSCLGTPPRQPGYRSRRSHAQFLENLPLSGERLRELIIAAWHPASLRETYPSAGVAELLQKHYSREEWNFSR